MSTKPAKKTKPKGPAPRRKAADQPAEPTTTRQRLLESALALISAKGYHGASTREIAERAGTAELTLFRTFGSKVKLFEEILKSCTFLPRLIDMLPELEEMPPRKALNHIGLRYIETLKERKDFVRIIMSEMTTYKPSGVHDVHMKFVGRMAQTMEGYFKRMQRRGKFRGVPASSAVKVFIGSLFIYFFTEEILKRRQVPKKELDRHLRATVDILMSGMGVE